MSKDTTQFDELPRGKGTMGATDEIARHLRDSGIDAASGLYDEALALARDGHLTPAAERLRMLLCLDPMDADASLLLGKMLAARGQFEEALANLDDAVTHGAILPPGLRDRVEAGLQQQIHSAEERRARLSRQELGELRALRAEAKQLRSENAGFELDIDKLQRRVRMWSGATAVIAGVSAALILALLLFGGGGEETIAVEAPAPTQVYAEPEPAEPPPVPVLAAEPEIVAEPEPEPEPVAPPPPDEDGDGVEDAKDLWCPDTPSGASVNSRTGCTRDQALTIGDENQVEIIHYNEQTRVIVARVQSLYPLGDGMVLVATWNPDLDAWEGGETMPVAQALELHK